MKPDVRLCTVFVHLRSKETYYEEMEQAQQAAVARAASTWASTGASSEAFEESRSRRYAEESAWRPPWRYNDVVAFLEIVYDGSQTVRADVYRMEGRVSRNRARKRFVYRGGCCAKAWVQPRSDDPAEAVQQAALQCIIDASQELSQRGWHADTEEALALLGAARFDELLSTLYRDSGGHESTA